MRRHHKGESEGCTHCDGVVRWEWTEGEGRDDKRRQQRQQERVVEAAEAIGEGSGGDGRKLQKQMVWDQSLTCCKIKEILLANKQMSKSCKA